MFVFLVLFHQKVKDLNLFYIELKDYLFLLIKGFGIGAANVIPGVSGGTIALITGIFERLIDAVKSFNMFTLKLILKGRFKEFVKHTDLFFLIAVFVGAGISIMSFAVLLEFLFDNYPVYVWSYFFGLIFASVFFVGKTIENKKNVSVIISFIIGTSIAFLFSILTPGAENSNFFFLILCGVVGIISMILPGLSGSFVLILMGNYRLVMSAITRFDLSILIPVGIGVVIGLPAFSQILSWIFKKFKDATLSVLTGFIFGSLGILWPWKNEIFLTKNGIIETNSKGEAIISGYERFLPDTITTEVLVAVALMLSGLLSIWLIERLSQKKEKIENRS